MFPGRYFAKRYFTGRYFEPPESAVPPVKPPERHYGSSRLGWRKTEDVIRELRIEYDDEEMMFWSG